MHANQPAATVLRFGDFEADVQSGELRKQGQRIRLQDQPFQLLVMLLEAPGQVVPRDELRSKLWPQTTVDFDHGLNKAISKIREALGDSPEHPRFVETVARRGYRFLADVAVVVTGAQKPSPTILHTKASRLFRPRCRQHIKKQGLAILLDCFSALAWRSRLHPPYHGYSTMRSILHLRFAPWRCCHWKMFPGTVRRIISPMA
jgi:DNA-binding winged helix-turn-helix (wHTH) protein